ncbi:MAG: hypothetical protein HWN66_04895 [Candidatus Helarchaeota archaeon]|nr:hypothetical protein [Candidatus Helarchaeota archaeon]
MTKKVCKFFEMLGKHTRFDRGDKKFHAYLKSNLERKRITYPRFMDYFKTIWEKYVKTVVGINLSRFFIENGNDFMKRWYTDVFTFPKSRIFFDFGQGGSQVDVLITVKYALSKIEFECLDEIIKKYNIENKGITSAALISLLEPCVLLAVELSTIIGQEIRISIEDREIENNIIILELSARPK